MPVTVDPVWARWRARDAEAVVTRALEGLPATTSRIIRAFREVSRTGVLRQVLDAFLKGELSDQRVLAMGVDMPPGELQQVIADAFRGSAQAVVGLLRDKAPRSSTFSLTFNDIDPHAVEWVRTRSSTLVTHVTQSMRETIRQVLSESLAEGLTGPQTAMRLEAVIPLRPDQLRRLNAYRSGLTASPARAQKLVADFADRLLAERAELIARTELVAAANAGQMEVWRQAVQAGLLPPQVQKRWSVYAGCCERCLDVAAAGPVPLDQDFTVMGWAVEAPPLHPRCRCAVVMEVPDPTTILLANGW